jgi:ABC-type transport system substrate-binding protein
MTLCMPRDRIAEDIWGGMAEVVTGPFFYHSPANDRSIEPWPFDPGQAAALLREAGWEDRDGDSVLEHATLQGEDGKPLEFRFKLLMYANSAEYANLANLFREELRQIGVVMDPLPVDWPLMQQKMEERDFDCYTGAWALGWEADPYQLWHSSQADLTKSSNRIGFRNAAADRIIEQLRVTLDEEERLPLLHRFHAIIHEEQPYTFLFMRSLPRVHHRCVVTVVYSLIRPQTLCSDWALDPACH